MKKILLTCTLLLMSIGQTWAWDAPSAVKCQKDTSNPVWINCVPPGTPASLPYQMNDGSVKVLSSTGRVFCKQGTCEYYDQDYSGLYYPTGEYAGTINSNDSKIPVYVVHGYYLGSLPDGSIFAYLKNMDPKVAANQLVTQPVAPLTDVDKCVNAVGDRLHAKYGQDVPVTADMLEVIESNCKAGRETEL